MFFRPNTCTPGLALPLTCHDSVAQRSLREDGETLVVKCGDDKRDFRMQADPQTFFLTDHYRGYPSVLPMILGLRTVIYHVK